MPEPPILAKSEAAPKVGPPVVLANAKATVGAIPAQVFEALTDAAQLGSWWAEDVRVDAQMSGVYEGTLPSRWQGVRKSTRLNSSHQIISYAVFCLKKKKGRRAGSGRRA